MLGENAPGTAFNFDLLSAPVLNDAGRTAFYALVDDTFVYEGIWSEGNTGVLSKVAATGDEAPNSEGAFFDAFDLPEETLQFNNLGKVAFLASLDDGRAGVFSDRDSPSQALTKVALDDDPAPGLSDPKDFQFGFDLHAFGEDHNGTAFVGNLSNTPTFPAGSHAVFSGGTTGSLNKVIEETEVAPGAMRNGGAALFEFLSTPSTNNSGHVVFSATTNASTSGGDLGAGGIWATSTAGSLRDVALAGHTAPGTSTTFSQSFSHLLNNFESTPAINDDGDIAFLATLVGLIEGSVRAGIWVERNGGVSKVVVESEVASDSGSTFESILSVPLIDDSGNAAFVAELADGRDGLWQETSPGNLQSIVLEGQNAPGTEASFVDVFDFAVNNSGQVAFLANLTDDIDGIFATNPNGMIKKIVAVGDIIEVDGVMAEVEFIDFQGAFGSLDFGGGSTNNGFNDSGLVAFVAEGVLMDGSDDFFSAIFVSDIASMSSGLLGDYNGNGIVDSADYTVWLAALGGTTLLNDSTPGTVDGSDYDYWKANFGVTSATSSGDGINASPIPEPYSLALVAIALLAISCVFKCRSVG